MMRTHSIVCALILLNSFSASSFDIVKRCETAGYARSISDYLVSDDSNGIVLFSPYSSKDDAPFCSSFRPFTTSGQAYATRVISDPYFVDPVVFVANGDSGLGILRSDTGTAWFHHKNYSVPGKSKAIEVRDSLIFVAGDSGLFIFELPCSAPDRRCPYPQQDLSLLYSEKYHCRGAEDVAVDEAYHAYILTSSGTIVYCNFWKPESIKVEFILRTYTDTCAIAAKGGFLYVVSYGRFLIHPPFTYGIFDPPMVAYGVPTSQSILPSHGRDIVLFGKYAYIAVDGSPPYGGFNGVLVYDVSDQRHPLFVDSCRTPGQAGGLYVDANYIYVACGDSGIAVIDNSASLENVSKPLNVRGNGVSGLAATITERGVRITIPAMAAMARRADILSVDGRIVRSLTRGNLNTDARSFHWDFRPSEGDEVTDGIYYVVVKDGALTLSAKFLKR
jgi:hypothetical protein